MQKHDKIRIQHMLDAIEEALSFAKNKGRESLDKDRMLVLALMKDVEIVGEAATRISKEAQRATPEIPWVNPNVAKAGGFQSQGVKGEAVTCYRNPLTTMDLKTSRFPGR